MMSVVSWWSSRSGPHGWLVLGFLGVAVRGCLELSDDCENCEAGGESVEAEVSFTPA
jgi:hypothetical protein